VWLIFWIACRLFGFIENLSKVLKTGILNSTNMAPGSAGRVARR